jgi:hypothetical protein
MGTTIHGVGDIGQVIAQIGNWLLLFFIILLLVLELSQRKSTHREMRILIEFN